MTFEILHLHEIHTVQCFEHYERIVEVIMTNTQINVKSLDLQSRS